MRHLSAERLAALADEHPTPDEATHLALCATCARERDAHRRLVAGAALERDRAAAPLTDWGAISARLRAEGIIRTPDETATPAEAPVPVLPFARGAAPAGSTPAAVEATPVARRRRIMPAWAMRAAAGLALVAGGALAGRATAGVGGPVATIDREAAIDTGSTAGLTPVSNIPTSSLFKSTDEAQRALVAAERTYQAAMQYLAMHDTTMNVRAGDDPTAVFRARLAALDEAVSATRNALSVAPYDPVINRYYLSSVSAREATLRQLDEALPVSEQLTRF